MKAKSFLFSMLAAATLVGCSSDDVMEEVGGGQVSADNKAYVALRLVNTSGSFSRATSPGFVTGSKLENEVNSVQFYFFNADGTFNQSPNSQAISWTTNTENLNPNIEKFSDAVVALQGINNKKDAPKYVIAVLNGKVNITPTNLTDFQDKVKGTCKEGDYFVMTNSTYNNAKSADSNNLDNKDFASYIDESKVLSEAPTMDQLTKDNAVTMHVERLAAKVGVGYDDKNPSFVKQENGDIHITLAKKYQVNGEEKSLELKILGWGLNATTKDSYYMKMIPASNETPLIKDWNWNDAGNFRSYWAKSTNYYAGNYPSSAANTTDATLNYINYANLTKKLGSVDYCNENTQSAESLKTLFNSKVTHVLLAAEIVKDGTNISDNNLVRYQGTLYTLDSFYKRALNQLGLNAWKKSGEKYTSISKDDLALQNIYDGKVALTLKSDPNAPKVEWYERKSETEWGTVDISEKVNSALKTINAEHFNQGKMYYNIPIEHLRAINGKLAFNENAEPVIKNNSEKKAVTEGQYGVVRNHWYNVTITKIANLGNAVHDPQEVIIPTTKKESYYVGAVINILSWKKVNQDVEL